MSLLDDLRAAVKNLDAQFQVASNEVAGVLSALVHHLDKGERFLEAAGEGGSVQDVTELLAPAPAQDGTGESAAAAASESSDLSDEELQARISDLQAQQAARRATGQQTQVDHQPGVGAEG